MCSRNNFLRICVLFVTKSRLPNPQFTNNYNFQFCFFIVWISLREIECRWRVILWWYQILHPKGKENKKPAIFIPWRTVLYRIIPYKLSSKCLFFIKILWILVYIRKYSIKDFSKPSPLKKSPYFACTVEPNWYHCGKFSVLSKTRRPV